MNRRPGTSTPDPEAELAIVESWNALRADDTPEWPVLFGALRLCDSEGSPDEAPHDAIKASFPTDSQM